MRFVVGLLTVVLAACGANGDANAGTSASTTTVFHGPGVEDLTGTMASWEFEEDVDSWGDIPDDFQWGIREPGSRTIEVGWWGLGCDDDPRLVVDIDVIELTLDGYLADRPDPDVGCAMMGIWREFLLTFAEPIDVGSLRLEVIEPPG